MSAFEYLGNALTYLRDWAYPPEPPVHESPQEAAKKIFSENILAISALRMGELDDRRESMIYIDKCIQAIGKDLKLLNFSLPLEARETLKKHWELFDNVLKSDDKYLAKWELHRIGLDFRFACLKSIKEKWSTDAAQKFYDIALLSDHKEKIAKAQHWSEQFAKGNSYFRDLARSLPHPEYFDLKALSDAVQTDFRNYYDNVMVQRAAGGISNSLPNFDQQIQLLHASIFSQYPQHGTRISFSDLLDSHSKKVKEYINSSIETVIKDIAPFDFSFPTRAQEKLTCHMKLFETTVEEKLSVTGDEAERIKAEFREKCSAAVKKIWSVDAARHFYDIFLRSNPERGSAAQKWSLQFATGAGYFSRLENNRSVDPKHFYPHELAESVSETFREYSKQNTTSEDELQHLDKKVEVLNVCMTKGVQREQCSPWPPEDESKWQESFTKEFADFAIPGP